MPEIISIDELLQKYKKKVDGKNRADIIRRCHELGRPVYLDFGGSDEDGFVQAVWDEEENPKTMKFWTPGEPCEIFSKYLHRLAGGVEQGNLVTALKGIQCRFGGNFWVKLEIINPHTTMTLNVDYGPGLILSENEKRCELLYAYLLNENWMEPNKDPSQPQRWKFLKPDDYLYALLGILKSNRFIQNKGEEVRKFLTHKDRPFLKCKSPNNSIYQKINYCDETENICRAAGVIT